MTLINRQSNRTVSLNDIYIKSILRSGSVKELLKTVTLNEDLDTSVEKFICEIADNFVERLLDDACSLTRHRKGKKLEPKDIQMILKLKSNTYDPSKNSDVITRVKRHEAMGLTTGDHRRRTDLSREESKAMN